MNLSFCIVSLGIWKHYANTAKFSLFLFIQLPWKGNYKKVWKWTRFLPFTENCYCKVSNYCEENVADSKGHVLPRWRCGLNSWLFNISEKWTVCSWFLYNWWSELTLSSKFPERYCKISWMSCQANIKKTYACSHYEPLFKDRNLKRSNINC